MTEMAVTIRRATAADAPEIARMVKALTDEIIEMIGQEHFDVDAQTSAVLFREWIGLGSYAAYIALDDESGRAIGGATLCESRSLYAQGVFGIIQEFYVAPQWRSREVGARLVEACVAHGRAAGWKRLELATPPLPEFARKVSFYKDNGFEPTGGRKMKRML
jgi:GNAT superfamily N-acetyltransferase